MNSAIRCIMKTIGQEIWERQITGETAGDTIMDVPVDTVKRHRVYGVFTVQTFEWFEKVGISEQADAVLFTNEQITMTSQIEYLSEVYEIHKEIVDNYYLMDKGYTYLLRLKGRHIG